MSMREYSCSGYLCDLSFLEEYKKGNLDEKQLKILNLLNLNEHYNKFGNEEHDFENFYDFLEEQNNEIGGFIVFSDEDNSEEFERGVLYLSLDEDDLFVRTKTKYNEDLEKAGIDFEFGNYGFWG